MRFSFMSESEPGMEDSRKIDFAILGAVKVESDPFSQLLSSYETFDFRGETFRLGFYADRYVLLGTTGIGKVNAAVTTAALLEHFPIGEVFNIGCAGAYCESPLCIGDVLVTRNALCGDEGILTGGYVRSSEHLGFPLVVQGREKFFDAFPLDRSANFSRILNAMPAGLYGRDGQPPSNQEQEPYRFKHDRGWKQEDASRQGKDVRSEDSSCRSSLLDGAPRGEYFRLVYGPSLTVGMVSGDGEVARRRFSRYEAFAENMEGSAVAQTCFRYKIPMMECRGISNMAGDRDKRNWRLETAILHCRSIVQKWLRIE